MLWNMKKYSHTKISRTASSEISTLLSPPFWFRTVVMFNVGVVLVDAPSALLNFEELSKITDEFSILHKNVDQLKN